MGGVLCHINIYCSLQTDLGVSLKPGGELVSVQVAETLGQKATEQKSLCTGEKRKINQ